jgi:hypothetical protein
MKIPQEDYVDIFLLPDGDSVLLAVCPLLINSIYLLFNKEIHDSAILLLNAGPYTGFCNIGIKEVYGIIGLNKYGLNGFRRRFGNDFKKIGRSFLFDGLLFDNIFNLYIDDLDFDFLLFPKSHLKDYMKHEIMELLTNKLGVFLKDGEYNSDLNILSAREMFDIEEIKSLNTSMIIRVHDNYDTAIYCRNKNDFRSVFSRTIINYVINCMLKYNKGKLNKAERNILLSAIKVGINEFGDEEINSILSCVNSRQMRIDFTKQMFDNNNCTISIELDDNSDSLKYKLIYDILNKCWKTQEIQGHPFVD